MNTVEIKIRGKVQGVFFRKYTQAKARELGLKGFVRNQPDKSVYVMAYGPQDKLSELIAWCKTGSPLSRVDEVTAENVSDLVSTFTGFEITG